MAKIQSVGSVAGKETIYVDVDDEITSIIDKVGGAKGKVIALVLPKRAAVLQSIVNMKLLKHTAENAQKNLVLITSEAGLLPLAGNVGLYVADTPTSKPYIPNAPDSPSDEPEDIDEPLNIVDNSAEDFDPKDVADKPVGDLAAGVAASKIAEEDIDESIDLDDAVAPAATAAAATKAPKPKKDKKLKVPNFNTFKKKLLLGAGVLALLIVGYVFAFIVLPKATVTIKTDTSTITTNLNLTLDTAAKTLDESSNTLPATAQTQQKPATQTVAATGQQNNGQKATGQIGITAGTCSATQPDDIAVGTSLSASGHTYILGERVSFNPQVSNRRCTYVGVNSSGQQQINVSALRGGADYNTGTTSFSVSGRSDVSASGNATGGTDDIKKIVSAGDITNATNQIKSSDSSSVKQQLTSALQAKGLQAVPSTFLAGDPQVTTSAKAGDAADNVTVTSVTTYTMLGAKKDDLKQLVEKNVNKQLDKGKQVILDDGVANATFTQQNPATATNATVAMQAKSVAGPQIDTAELKPQLYGKKTGDVKSLLQQTPGVTSVDVKYSPFWVHTVPKKDSKVTVQIDKSGMQ